MKNIVFLDPAVRVKRYDVLSAVGELRNSYAALITNQLLVKANGFLQDLWHHD